jgi:hypothetical protein
MFRICIILVPSHLGLYSNKPRQLWSLQWGVSDSPQGCHRLRDAVIRGALFTRIISVEPVI